jgi:DNA-binding response OmpR family regulator
MGNAERGDLTALVVEDDGATLTGLVELLRHAGFTPTGVERGQAALDKLAQQAYDLLLIDLHLPDGDGLEICHTARQRYGERPTILMLTADQRVERWLTAFALGADDLVAKPFDVEVLLARIQAKLRQVGRTAA